MWNGYWFFSPPVWSQGQWMYCWKSQEYASRRLWRNIKSAHAACCYCPVKITFIFTFTGEMVRQARVLAQATSDLVNAMRSDAEAEIDVDNSKKLLAAAKLLADATARMVEAAKVWKLKQDTNCIYSIKKIPWICHNFIPWNHVCFDRYHDNFHQIIHLCFVNNFCFTFLYFISFLFWVFRLA